MTRGKFVVLEGIDGAGTTTQTGLLARNLPHIANITTWQTREPTISVIGCEARELAARGGDDPALRARTALLFAADRLEHCQYIELELAQGNWVICDRYFPSSLVYQGKPDSNIVWIEEINRYAKDPDITVLIDTSPEVAYERIRLRGSVGDANETLLKLEEHRARYRRLFPWGIPQLPIVDGDRDERAVHVDIVFAINGLIRAYHNEQDRVSTR